jgi:hypothetical protein
MLVLTFEMGIVASVLAAVISAGLCCLYQAYSWYLRSLSNDSWGACAGLSSENETQDRTRPETRQSKLGTEQDDSPAASTTAHQFFVKGVVDAIVAEAQHLPRATTWSLPTANSVSSCVPAIAAKMQGGDLEVMKGNAYSVVGSKEEALQAVLKAMGKLTAHCHSAKVNTICSISFST